MKSQNGFSVVEVLIVIALAGLVITVGWKVWDTKKTSSKISEVESNETQQISSLNKGDFGDFRDYVMFQANGYAKTVQVDDTSADCGMSNPGIPCPKMDAIYFVVTETPNANLTEYLKSIHIEDTPDNSFQIGCLVDESITYTNSSDIETEKEFKISKTDSAKLLTATNAEPASIEITKQKLTYGRDAPTCYSHFTSYKLLN
jgi:prepilin-type N-terminal cleavage/methylation domain-containing protein